MELENIVANTIYINAKESGNSKDVCRSSKWTKILKFPHISQCIAIANEIEKSYDYIVEQQPIGHKLFWYFCMDVLELKKSVEFLDKVRKYELVIDEERLDFGTIIFNGFLWNNVIKSAGRDNRKAVAQALQRHRRAAVTAAVIADAAAEAAESGQPEAAARAVREAGGAGASEASSAVPSKDLFKTCAESVRAYLCSKPFDEFLESVYFHRYLQWKWIERQPITKRTFRMYRVLGKGGFGEVCACQVRSTGKLYACKKLEKKRIKKRSGEKMALNEKQIMERVHSRFVVSLAYAFETRTSLCLVLTIMNGGDLKFHIHNMPQLLPQKGASKAHRTPGFDEPRAVFYAAEITCGLEHLHSMGIVYRDLKPENILIDDVGHVRISDLGLAVEVDESGFVQGKVGTVGYMAPEVVRGERYSYPVDWFGLGCIVFEMVSGQAPFRHRKERVKREEVDRRVKEDQEVYSDRFSGPAQALCRRLLAKDPAERLGSGRGAKELREHEFFSTVSWTRLEAGVAQVPFAPDPHAVYAKDLLDIEQFSSIKGVHLDEKDAEFYSLFNTGAVSTPFQEEMIETECFEDLDVYYKPDGSLIDSLNPDRPPAQPKPGLLARLFRTKTDRLSSSSVTCSTNKSYSELK